MSVIVPSRDRAACLVRLLDGLAAQQLPAGVRMETVVALDGEGPAANIEAAAARARHPVHVLPLPRVGIAAAKNRAVGKSCGDLLLFLNDDVEPAPDLVAQHLAAGGPLGYRHMVVGRADWAVPPGDTVMDALIRGTSMVFFYDRMAPGGFYGFRHAWNLNLSVARSLFEGVGGFQEEFRPCMHEDIELGWRLEQKGARVFYAAAAQVRHSHRYTWEGYLRREAMLGIMSSVMAGANPACFRAVFGETPERLEQDFAAWLARDGNRHHGRAESLSAILAKPSSAVPRAGEWTSRLYKAHLPVKRRAFRKAFLIGRAELSSTPWEERWALAQKAFPL